MLSRSIRFFLGNCALAAIVASTRPTLAAPAKSPVISPSVIAASRLKYHPPRGWIRHYLGDDRYKISGGVWRVVTTPNDRYYYPPFAREMLVASPDGIIGFASAQDAQEAGYAPHPIYGSAYGIDTSLLAKEDMREEVKPPGEQSGISIGRLNPNYKPHVVNNSRKNIRIVLADQRSTLMLPPKWEYVSLPSGTLQTSYGAMLDQNDLVRPIGNKANYLIFDIQTLPTGINTAKLLSQQSDAIASLGNTMSKALSKSGLVNNRIDNIFKDVRPRSFKLAGISGYVHTGPGQAIIAGQQIWPVQTIGTVGKKNKVYMLGIRGSTGAAGRTVIRSFRAR